MESELSRSQMVIPFGVGATYDYLNFSAISLATDYWEIPPEHNSFHKLKIKNPRLLKFINKKLKTLEGDKYSWVAYLLNAPIKRENGMPVGLYDLVYPLPVSKFPEYYVCPRCSHLSKPHRTAEDRQRCQNEHKPKWLNKPCSVLNRYSKRFLEPIRFIGFCEDGHIQDVPWKDIMKAFCEDSCSEMDKPNPNLYLRDDGRGFGFASLNLSCGTCNKRKNLTGIQKKEDRERYFKNKNGDQIIFCKGEKPWLPKNENQNCEKYLQIEPRAASKIYMPEQEIGLYIPDENDERHPLKDQDIYQSVSEKYEGDDELLEKTVEMFVAPIARDLEPPLNVVQIMRLIKEDKNQKDSIRTEDVDIESEKDDFYYKEFRVLTDNLTTDDYVSISENFDNFNEFTKRHLTSLHAIKKLKATSVLLGFTRGGNKFNPAREKSNFLPGFEVSGEGIFLNIGYEKIKKWLDENRKFENRKRILLERSKLDFRTYPPLFSEPGFIMLHTLSHALMRQLSLESGYGINELKERIYFSHKNEMAGILIYTSSSDSSGSMGGLVRRVKPELFDGTFENAVNNSMNCSNDPICSDSSGQGLAGLSLAACHACSMVPDLACEIVPKNTFLDRTMLIGNLENEKGYFSN